MLLKGRRQTHRSSGQSVCNLQVVLLDIKDSNSVQHFISNLLLFIFYFGSLLPTDNRSQCSSIVFVVVPISEPFFVQVTVTVIETVPEILQLLL